MMKAGLGGTEICSVGYGNNKLRDR